MQEIHSKDNQYIKLATSLHKKKTRDELGCFIIEGNTLLEEAIKKNQTIKHVFFLEETYYAKFKSLLNAETDCFIINENLMSKISSTETAPPLVAIIEKTQTKQEIKQGNFFIYGDDISDPGNLGSIIRTSFASGINKIFLSPNSCDIHNSKTLRSSVGTVFYGDIQYLDLTSVIQNLKSLANDQNKSLKVIGTSSHASRSIFNSNFDPNDIHLILLGSEAKGLSQEAIDACTELISIPLHNDIESINVLAAASVILFEISKQIVVCHPEGAKRP